MQPASKSGILGRQHCLACTPGVEWDAPAPTTNTRASFWEELQDGWVWFKACPRDFARTLQELPDV